MNCFDQIALVLADYTRIDAPLPQDWADQRRDLTRRIVVALRDHTRNGAPPMPPDAIAEAFAQSVLATNHLAGGGASGYLAAITLLMDQFQEDFLHANRILAHWLERRMADADRPDDGSAN